MIMKLAVGRQFIQTFLFPESQEIYYIGGADVLPAPLGVEEENTAIAELGTEREEEAYRASALAAHERAFSRSINVTGRKDYVVSFFFVLRSEASAYAIERCEYILARGKISDAAVPRKRRADYESVRKAFRRRRAYASRSFAFFYPYIHISLSFQQSYLWLRDIPQSRVPLS